MTDAVVRQAVNKLAEILNRKDMKLDQKKKGGSTADLRKKEKENRKLQLELNQEKEKFSHLAIKYQKEVGEIQVVSRKMFPEILGGGRGGGTHNTVF